MLVSEPPYTGGTPQAVLGKIITGTPESAPEAAWGLDRSGSGAYDVALDDERFLMQRRVESRDSGEELILVQNFFEELKRVVPN